MEPVPLFKTLKYLDCQNKGIPPGIYQLMMCMRERNDSIKSWEVGSFEGEDSYEWFCTDFADEAEPFARVADGCINMKPLNDWLRANGCADGETVHIGVWW